MTGGVPSVQTAGDAFALELNVSREQDALEDEGGFDAAASGNISDHSHSNTHQMHALLVRAVEAGQFDGTVNNHFAANQATLQRVLAQLESAKIQLDRVRLRG